VADKILVIDDSKVIRMRVRDMLPQGDFEILEAGDGVEGLKLIQNEHPTLIMLDFLMPRMSGWEVFQEIQSSHDYQRIPLVVMSGRKEEVTDRLQEPFELFEFIEKPFEQKDLMEAIKSAMLKARQRRPVISSGLSDGASAAEIQSLQSRIAALEEELAQVKTLLHNETNLLKKQIVQVVTFLKKKGM
jgi:CheY-like chemotaxis protein